MGLARLPTPEPQTHNPQHKQHVTNISSKLTTYTPAYTFHNN